MPHQMEVRERLMKLRQEHRDLDDAIARMSEGPSVNEVQLKRMKVRKLQLKDFIARLLLRVGELEEQLRQAVPALIADAAEETPPPHY